MASEIEGLTISIRISQEFREQLPRWKKKMVKVIETLETMKD